jgi:hypothetical protein
VIGKDFAHLRGAEGIAEQDGIENGAGEGDERRRHQDLLKMGSLGSNIL